MIIFSWTLTPNQVLALRDVAEHHHRYKEAAAKRQFLRNGENELDTHNLKHWIGATRHLIREGFVVHKEVPWEPWELKHQPYAKSRTAWEITAKGLLVLQMVEIEVNQQAQVLKIEKAELKLLQKSIA